MHTLVSLAPKGMTPYEPIFVSKYPVFQNSIMVSIFCTEYQAVEENPKLPRVDFVYISFFVPRIAS